MAVAYDTDTQALQNVSVSTVTFSHTVTGANPAIVVFVDLIGTAQTVSSVTYAGASLSSIGALDNNNVNPCRIEAWALANCASGANNVVVTLSANNSAWDASAISFTGAHQTQGSNFTGFQSANLGSASTGTVTVTTGATGDMVVDATVSTSNNGTTAGAGQTQQWRDNAGNTNTQGSTKAGGASVDMVENWDGTGFTKSLVALNVVQVAAAFDELISSRLLLSVP